MPPRRPYFYGSNRARSLLAQLAKWQGTRWRHAGAKPNEMRCGVSGDCLFWVHVFKAIDALPAKLTIPDYRLQEARADEMKTLRQCIMATGRAQLVWERDSIANYRGKADDELHRLGLPWLIVGDVLIYKNGTSGAHCGLVANVAPIQFVHLTGNGLLEEPLHQKHYLQSLTYIYRLLEPELSVERSALNVGSLGVSQ
ncbi:MAG TPA: hypothetical protein VNL17_08665 [Verrucomicrobiae bacterium]|nr:hypothetical protein [Verrucomicrobiae bacterium]